jgi:hypothetical protein
MDIRSSKHNSHTSNLKLLISGSIPPTSKLSQHVHPRRRRRLQQHQVPKGSRLFNPHLRQQRWQAHSEGRSAAAETHKGADQSLAQSQPVIQQWFLFPSLHSKKTRSQCRKHFILSHTSHATSVEINQLSISVHDGIFSLVGLFFSFNCIFCQQNAAALTNALYYHFTERSGLTVQYHESNATRKSEVQNLCTRKQAALNRDPENEGAISMHEARFEAKYPEHSVT